MTRVRRTWNIPIVLALAASPVMPAAAGTGGSPALQPDRVRVISSSDRAPAPEEWPAPESGINTRGAPDCGDESITQSTNPDTVTAPSVWCGTLESSALTSVARGFTITEDVSLTCLTFGVSECSGGDWPVRVRLLQGNPGDSYDSLALLAESEYLIPDGTDRQLFTVQTPQITMVAGGNYIVELLTPSRLLDEGGDGGLIALGFNNLGQSAPSYLRAPGCGVDNFVTLQSIGFGNRHLVMSLGVAVPNCYVCNPAPPGVRVEGEAHCATATNGGCDIASPAFTRISDECSWCGNLWLDDPDYDTDWYRFDLSAPGNVTINLAVDASFGVIVEVYEASGCPVGPTELVDTYDVRCYPGLSSRPMSLNAGTHLIRLVPGSLVNGPYSNSGISCGYGVNYQISVIGVPGSCDDDPDEPCEPISLEDPSFETAPLNSYVSVLNNFTGLAGEWGAENGAIVTGTVDGVTPTHGTKMLRLANDGLTVSQVVQVLDLTAFATQVDAGNLDAEFSAFFNASSGVSAPAAYAMLRYYSGPGLTFQTGTNSLGRTFDGSPATWERHAVTATIPAGTRWMVAEIGFSNATIGSLAGFVDDADLCIRQTETDDSACQVFWTATSNNWPDPPSILTASYNGSGATNYSPAASPFLAFTKLPNPHVFWSSGSAIVYADPTVVPAVPSVLPGLACVGNSPEIAVSAQHVYLGCPTNLTIHQVDRAFPHTITQLNLTPQLGTLRGILFDDQNNRLLIAKDGPGNGEIWSYNPVSQAFTPVYAVDPAASPRYPLVVGMDLDRVTGDLYVLGYYSYRFTPDQSFIRRITPAGLQSNVLLDQPGLSGPVGFVSNGLHDIAVDPHAGRMWWTSRNISGVAEVRTATLAGGSPTVIATGLPGQVFQGLVVTRCCPVDLNGDGILDLGDIVAFVNAFIMFDPLADLDQNGIFDLADVVDFVSAFGAGCP